MSVQPADLTLSDVMQSRIARGELAESKVREKTAAAFDLIVSPILKHYNNKDLKELQKLLQTGLVDANALCNVRLKSPLSKDDTLQTGLVHLAVIKLKYDIIRLLCEHGADPNLLNSDGNPPLHNVCFDDLERSHPMNNRVRSTDEGALIRLVYALVNCGADPNMRNRSGGNALSEAMGKNAFYLCSFYASLGTDFSIDTFPRAVNDPRRSLYHRLIDMRNDIHANGPHFQSTSRDELAELNDCIGLIRDAHKQLRAWAAEDPRRRPDKDMVLQAANLGEVAQCFIPELWSDAPEKALELILSLPPFVQHQLETQLAFFAQKTDIATQTLPVGSWSSRLAESREKELTPSR